MSGYEVYVSKMEQTNTTEQMSVSREAAENLELQQRQEDQMRSSPKELPRGIFYTQSPDFQISSSVQA